MTGIERCVRTIRQRQLRQLLWRCASAGLLISSLLACAIALTSMFLDGGFAWTWVVGIVIAGPVIGLLVAIFRSPTMLDAAFAIDQTCKLKDRTQTALYFLRRGSDKPLQQLQLADAEAHLADVDPAKVVPLRRPRTFSIAVLTSLAAVALIIFSPPRQQADAAAPVANAALVGMADRAEQGLEELREFQQEQPDPELEKLLREMAEKIEMLKEPGMDPKEALAQLSEMETALEEMQQNLSESSMEAELEKIGEALSLSEAMAVAGVALSKGEMEKAAEELAKLELPELDQKTEKAVTEKLAEIKENQGEGQSRKELKEAAGQIAAGLSKGDRNKFKEGMEGLAGECKKQGQRKKLTDLLRKQCQCLGECKSECESECKSEGQNAKPGGNKAGSAASGNEPGDKTAPLKANPQMNITGQDSGQGDVDVETEEANPQKQAAVRQYRQKIDQYEAMTESVLSSEAIPLGHRQTIRRYFESIRPQGNEIDQVDEQLAPNDNDE